MDDEPEATEVLVDGAWYPAQILSWSGTEVRLGEITPPMADRAIGKIKKG